MERLSPRRRPPSVISVQLVASAADSRSVKIEQNQRQAAPPAKAPAPETKSLSMPRAERKLVSIRPKEVEPPPRPKPKPKPEPTPKPRAVKPTKDPVAALKMSAQPSAAEQGKAGRPGELTREELDYISMLRQRIRENWRAYLPPGEEFLGEVRIEIAADGRIRDIDFLKGSGKSHVDDSILRALRNAALPPPPRSLADQPLLLRFWPSGA
jgi:protein TonB